MGDKLTIPRSGTLGIKVFDPWDCPKCGAKDIATASCKSCGYGTWGRVNRDGKSIAKRLSIQRRVDLIFAFFRDARTTVLRLDPEAMRHNAQLRKEVQRQIENAVRDDRDLRDGVPIELSNEELCPACGVPTVQHGTIKAGKWNVTICAGVSGQNLFVIGPDAAMALVEQLKEKDVRQTAEEDAPEIGSDDPPEPDLKTEIPANAV